MKQELDRFLDQLEKLFQTFFTVIPKNWKFKEKLNKTKLLFKQDLIKQFIKFIFEDGNYFSGTYDIIEKKFLEQMKYKSFLKEYLKEKKCLIKNKNYQKKKFLIKKKIFFYTKWKFLKLTY